MEKTKIIVTGGAGFVGSHLCETLASSVDNEVISIDNYFTGSKNNHVDNVEYIRGDAADIHGLVENANVVFHLGEYSRVEQSFDDIDIVFGKNAQSMFNILKFCKEHNAKLIYSGSSTKFADGGIGPHQSPYAWLKSSNTDLVNAYAKWFGIDYAITYFYNVYGPREISTGKYATVIAKFAEKMKQGQPLTIHKPGIQRRNFTHVNDIISGLIYVYKYGSGDGYGIGNSKSYSVSEIVDIFNPNEIQYEQEKPGNRMSGIVMSEQTKALGWRPKYDVIDYIEQLRANNWSL